MATVTWRGDAPAVAQVDTLTVGGTIEVGDLFNITINGKTLTYSATSTSTSTTAAAIAAAFNASTVPEFQEMTAAAVSSTVTLTADAPGKPFVVSVSTTEGDGSTADTQTFTRTSTTASSGPNDWSTAANWSGGSVPTNSDDVFIQNSAIAILYGLDQHSVTLASLSIDMSFTGTIGLPRTAGSGISSYVEYRDSYLRIGATTVNVGRGDLGPGSGRIKLDTGSAQTTLNVLNTGTPADASSGLKSFLWKGTHASNVANINKGSFGAAVFAGETATIATFNEAFLTSVAGDSDVKLGTGCTLTTINKLGGKLEINSNFTTLTNIAGDAIIGSGTATTINLYDGTIHYRSSGTLTTANLFGGTLDFTQDQRARTVTNCTLYKGASLLDREKSVTFTNNMVIKGQLSDVTLDLGYQITLARS